MASRTRRSGIVGAIVDLFKQIDGSSSYLSNTYDNVYPKLIFWDEIKDFPTISVVAGQESREYLPSDFKWGFLLINIRIYVEGDDPKELLEDLFADMETMLDNNNSLTIDSNTECTDIRILSISDDEGLLAPLGVGEMTLQVRYTA